MIRSGATQFVWTLRGTILLSAFLFASAPGHAQYVDPKADLPPLTVPEKRAPESEPENPLAPNLPTPAVTTLNLPAAIEEAYRNSPKLKIADAEVRKAHWRYQVAVSQPSATLSVGTFLGHGQAVLNNSYSSYDYDFYLSATQTFLAIGTEGTAHSRAVEDYNRTLADRRGAQMDLYQQVKDAFYELLASQELQITVKKNMDIAEQLYTLTDKKVAAGASPRLDLINAEIDRSRARQTALDAKTRLSAAQANLNSLLGRAARHPLQAEGAYFSLPKLSLTREDLLKLAKTNAKLESKEHALEFAKWDAILTEQGRNPYLSLSVVYDITNPGYQVSGQLNVPLDWGQIRNAAREKDEIVKSSSYSMQDMALNLASNLQSNYGTYNFTSQNAAVFLKEILYPAEEALNITKFGYTRGALPFLQVLVAEQRLVQSRTDYLDVLLKVRNAFHQLELAAGQPLEAPWSQPLDSTTQLETPATNSLVQAQP